MPEFDHLTDAPRVPDDLCDPTIAPGGQRRPSDPPPTLEDDRRVLAWLQCSAELGSEATGYICDALLDWSLNGNRPYPDEALPDAGRDCDHLHALKEIIERIPQRIIDAETVAEKMELGRAGRLLRRAGWAAFDPQAVRDAIGRELVMQMPWLTGRPAPFVLPDGRVL